MKKKYFFFFLIFCLVFLSIKKEVYAISEYAILEKFSDCEKEIIKAVSQVEIEYEDQLQLFLDLRSSQADAKAKILPLYLRTYQCQLEYICESVENPSKDTFGSTYSLCKKLSAKEFLEKYNLDFSSCSNIETIYRSNILSICKKFIEKKQKESFTFASKVFIRQSGIENQSFLSAKIYNLQKKMKILYEKTKRFSRNFNKVMGDIQCTIPDKSGK